MEKFFLFIFSLFFSSIMEVRAKATSRISASFERIPLIQAKAFS